MFTSWNRTQVSGEHRDLQGMIYSVPQGDLCNISSQTSWIETSWLFSVVKSGPDATAWLFLYCSGSRLWGRPASIPDRAHQAQIDHTTFYAAFFFSLSWRNFGTLRVKGWVRSSRSSSSDLLATDCPRGFQAYPKRHPHPDAAVESTGGLPWRELAESWLLPFQNNSFGPYLGLRLPSSSPGKEVIKSKVTDEMSGPSRLWWVTDCGLGEKPWHQSTDGQTRQTHKSLAVSHPKPFKDNSTPKRFSVKPLNCI